MKTATVRELRNHYSRLMRWVAAGEEVAISRRGKVVARLVPDSASQPRHVDWSTSAAARMDKSGMRQLTAKESADLLAASRGDY
jgi:prevent-host-death family protein